MNCKPGDMALVVKGRLSGHICDVERLADPGWYGPAKWEIRFRDPQVADTGRPVREGVMADSNLKPLRPDELQEPAEQREPATA